MVELKALTETQQGQLNTIFVKIQMQILSIFLLNVANLAPHVKHISNLHYDKIDF